ncbi:hypothetical protein ACPXCE_09290 [Streptomyces sp. DT24]|uniref:hypothetical protein n=1 Tax=unclassified Streptomyces TaxID=2593676 RepID=UPI0023BA3A5B|nr:hypothetical protein [Streptomyces sp. AM 4-1-1]WEH33632.1 hypothetical protein PZB75_09745 [Streptomyces sp. AM 4-1-1]
MKQTILGYMRAYDSMPDEQIMENELQMFRWAQAEGCDLSVIYQETDEGSIAVLLELVQELQMTGDKAVLVPSIAHFGDSRILQDHLYEYVVRCAFPTVEVHEVAKS